MLDIQLLRADLAAVAKRLADRGYALPVAEFEKLEASRKAVQTETQDLQGNRNQLSKEVEDKKAKRNKLAKKVGKKKAKGEDAASLIAQVNAQAELLKAKEQELVQIQAKVDEFLLGVPN